MTADRIAGRQKRGRSIAMTQREVDAFLMREKTCRVATVDAGGNPHVAPLGFVWDRTSVWPNSIIRSQRWVDLERDRRNAIVVDAETRSPNCMASRSAEPPRGSATFLAEPVGTML